MELSSFWYGLPGDIDHVDAVYERGNHDIVFFVGRNYYVMSGNSQLKHGPLPLTVKLLLTRTCLTFSQNWLKIRKYNSEGVKREICLANNLFPLIR